MGTTAARSINLTFTGDNNGTNILSAATNTNSPGDVDVVALASGDNVIELPVVGSLRAVSITKPENNTVAIKLKGNAADVGLPLHLTDPDSLSLGASPVIILNAAGPVNVRLFWS